MSTTLRTLCLGLLLTLSSMAGCTSNPSENDDTEPVYTWGNNTTLFIYEHVEQDAVSGATPYFLHFVANPMAEFSPYEMTQICFKESGSELDVWSASVVQGFNSITSWKMKNTNDIVLGMFASEELGATSTMESPTVIFRQNASFNDGHIMVSPIDQSTYDCPQSTSTQPIDTDGDGIDDANDKCPQTPAGEIADAIGCSPSQTDSDSDGISDADDACPQTPAGENVDATGCSPSQTDSDGDGISDANDACPQTPAGDNVDATGCGPSESDSDGDGISDANDACPQTPAGENVDATGCGSSQTDSDGDGVYDDADQCPNTPANLGVDANGCPSQTADSDNDGMPDSWEVDNGLNPLNASDGESRQCLWDTNGNYTCPNELIVDPDVDGINNVQEFENGTDPQNEDTDGDGVPDGWEAQYGTDPLTNDNSTDYDNDSVTELEEFTLGSNPFNNDTDGDGLPDGWEAQFGTEMHPSTYWPVFGPLFYAHMEDYPGFTSWDDFESYHILDPNSNIEDPDGDGFPNTCEYHFGTDPLASNDFPHQEQLAQCPDIDGDGWNDYYELMLYSDPLNSSIVPTDTDNDGVPDGWDSFPLDDTEWSDYDNDSIGDNADTDDDNDGVPDSLDMFPYSTGAWIDINGDGFADTGQSANGWNWLNSSGVGTMTIDYVMIGLVEGHEIYWLSGSPLCPCYAYYYTTTPDVIWTDGDRSQLDSVSNLPNVEFVLNAMGMSIDNLTTSTDVMNLGTDTEGDEWTYDSTTKIEWRNYSATTSTLYLDDSPIFYVNTSLEMYLDYTNLMSSMGQNPIDLWGESSVSQLYQFDAADYNLMTLTLYHAFLNDLGQSGMNYSFESQDSIIQNTYEWYSGEPANATALLQSIAQHSPSPLVGGLYDNITSNITEQISEESNGVTTTSPRSYTDEGASSRDEESDSED